MKTVKVRKFDRTTRAMMPDKTENYVDMAIGADFEDQVHQQYPSARATVSGLHDDRPVMAFLQDNNVRAVDAIRALNPRQYGNMRAVTVGQLLTDTGVRPLFGPMVQEQIAQGFQDIANNWQDLVTTVPIAASSIEDFQFEDPNGSNKDSYVLRLLGQGARIPTATITVSGKTVYLTYKGRGIEWSDKALRAPMPLAERWMRGVGMQLGRSYFNHIGIVLRDGYFDDMSDAPDVVLTSDTTKFQLGDILRGLALLSMTNGYPATDLMMSSNSSIDLLTQTIPGGGGYVFPDGIVSRLDGVERVHINDAVGPDVIIPFNRGMALDRYEAKAFGTEDERTVSQGITATYATLEDEIVVGEKKARVVIKKNWV